MVKEDGGQRSETLSSWSDASDGWMVELAFLRIRRGVAWQGLRSTATLQRHMLDVGIVKGCKCCNANYITNNNSNRLDHSYKTQS